MMMNSNNLEFYLYIAGGDQRKGVGVGKSSEGEDTLRRRRETHEHARTRARRAVRSTRTPTRARTHAHTRTRARAHTHTHTYLLLLRPIAIGRLHVGLSATILDEQEIFASKDFGTSDTCHLLARGGVRGGFIVGMAALDCRQRPRSRLAACAPARIR